MSDAFLQSDLSLDVRAALAEIDRLNEALSRATTNVPVTVDARPITESIDAAVAAADADVQVEGDATDVTSAIDASVDAADALVDVAADASDVTSAIDASVDAADALVVAEADAGAVTAAIDSAVDDADSTVTVDGQISPGLAAGVSGISSELEEANRQARGLEVNLRNVALVLGGYLTGSFLQAGAAYNTLMQTSRAAFTTILGSAEEAGALLDEIAQFAMSSPFPRQAFISATQTLLAFGTAAERVVPILGAVQDAVAAAGGSASDIEEIVTVLARVQSTGKITGETLNQLGFRGIDAAAIIGEQFGQTANEIRESITRGTLDAEAALVALTDGMTARFGGAAEGVKDTWVGAVDRIKGALRDISSELLTPWIDPEGGGAAIDLANAFADALRRIQREVVPVIQEMSARLAPALADLGKAAFPLLQSAIEGLLPLMGTTTQVMLILAPVLEVIANLTNMLAPEIVALASGFLLVNRAMRTSQWLAQSNAVRGLGSALAGAVGPLSQFRADFVNLSAGAAFRNLGRNLRSITTGVTGLSLAVGAGFTALSMYSGMMADSRREGEEWVATIRDQYDLAKMSGEELVALAERLRTGAQDLRAEMSGGIRGATIDRDFNESLKAGAEGLEQFREEVLEAERALREAEFRAEFDPLVKQLVDTGDALDRLRDKAPDVAGQIQSLRLGAEGTSKRFLDLAIAMHAAELSEEAMGDAAALLGVDIEELSAIVESAGRTLEDFVDTAAGQLPTLSDAFKTSGDNVDLTIAGFIQNLTEATTAMEVFRTDLQVITEAGFADLAALIAEQGPEIGGSLAAEMADAIRTGNVEIVEAAQEAVTGFQNEWDLTVEWFRSTLGPEMILEAGLLGSGLTDAFGSELSFDERLRIAGGLAKLQMSAEGKAVAAIAAAEGERAARRYGDALGLDEETIDAAVKAGRAIRDNAPTADARAAGSATGKAYGEGMESGIFGMIGAVASAAAGLVRSAAARARAEAREASPSRLFAEIGENMALGMAVGMEAETARVRDSSAALVAAAADAAMSVDRALVAPGLVSGSTAATGGGGTVLQIAQGAVVVSFSGAVSEADARMAGGAVLDGIVDAAFRRQVAVDIRTSRGQVI